MRRLWASCVAAAVISAGALSAQDASQDNPVVVELYTSQGCSSCPPADALMTELAGRDDVIALALHVDYWDYIGWKDSFASRDYTNRQRAYARAAGHRTIYTPQMIVGGTDHVVGFKPMKLADLIDAHQEAEPLVDLDLSREGDTLTIRAEGLKPLPSSILVQLVRYMPENTVEIRKGENAGRTITYANIVSGWDMLAGWDGQGLLELTAEAPGPEPLVVILQEAGHGAILAAARLR
ncbi:DUF1223 domain-containing protein [Psychromarinibacter sp. S121]|uniref:DUF1223 domain-containing protein n=1 Tax=Psychromarinibacter sp. S121 TaxID=3415127 RepID=UPI003C7C635D